MTVHTGHAIRHHTTSITQQDATTASLRDQRLCTKATDTIVLCEYRQISNETVGRPAEMFIVNTLLLGIHGSERISNDVFQERSGVDGS